jgi:multiple antibiotic resistance protein
MTAEDVRFAVVACSAMLVVVDPLSVVPLFLSITPHADAAARRQMAWRAAVAAFVTLSGFALGGGIIFELFGISLGAFKIAGGLMLLLMAVDMMRAQPSPTRSTPLERRESAEKEDVAVVPLAIPMLAGPGAMATVVVLMTQAGSAPLRTATVLLAIAVTCTVAWLLLRAATRVQRLLSRTTMRAFERIMGLVLAAVASSSRRAASAICCPRSPADASYRSTRCQ